MIFQHFSQNLFQVFINNGINELAYFLVIDGVGGKVIDVVEMSEMYHAEYGHSQGKDCAFVGDSVGSCLHFEYFECFRCIVELFIRIEVKNMIAQIGANNFTDSLGIDDNIIRVESIME